MEGDGDGDRGIPRYLPEDHHVPWRQLSANTRAREILEVFLWFFDEHRLLEPASVSTRTTMTTSSSSRITTAPFPQYDQANRDHRIAMRMIEEHPTLGEQIYDRLIRTGRMTFNDFATAVIARGHDRIVQAPGIVHNLRRAFEELTYNPDIAERLQGQLADAELGLVMTLFRRIARWRRYYWEDRMPTESGLIDFENHHGLRMGDTDVAGDQDIRSRPSRRGVLPKRPILTTNPNSPQFFVTQFLRDRGLLNISKQELLRRIATYDSDFRRAVLESLLADAPSSPARSSNVERLDEAGPSNRNRRAILVPIASTATQPLVISDQWLVGSTTPRVALPPPQPPPSPPPPTLPEDEFSLHNLVNAELAARRQDEAQTAAALAPERARHAELMRSVRNVNQAIAEGVVLLGGTPNQATTPANPVQVVSVPAETVITIDDDYGDEDADIDLNEEEDEWTRTNPYIGPSTILVPIAINQAQPSTSSYNRGGGRPPRTLEERLLDQIMQGRPNWERPSRALWFSRADQARVIAAIRPYILGGDVRILPEQASAHVRHTGRTGPPPALRFRLGDTWYKREQLLRLVDTNPDRVVSEMMDAFSRMRFRAPLNTPDMSNWALETLFMTLATNQLHFRSLEQRDSFWDRVTHYIQQRRPNH